MERASSVCPACRAAAAADARFCSRCGTPLVRPEEARRTVTAWFADVVGSTPLAERLDPEDFRAVVGEAVSLMAGAVEAFGGTVEHVAGDGLLGLFGAPQAHEDDAERAVLAGLRLVEDIRARAGEPIAVRVGIETGLAIVGPLAHVELTAMGDSVNTAARLQAEAAPNAVLVGERTQQLVADAFEWGERRDLELKGKAGAVGALPALRARQRPDVRPATALVGREHELASGHEALEEAAAGQGGVLAVVGEAGIGKSRLVAELRARWTAMALPGALWLDTRCVSYGRGSPFLPLRQPLRDPALIEGSGDLVPALEPLRGTGKDQGPLEGPNPARARRRSFDAVRTLLERRADRGPLVLALDDAHWADASSVALVEHVLPALRAAPILLVVATRPESGGPGQALVRSARRALAARVREVRLLPLAEDSGKQLLEQLAGPTVLSDELAREVLSRAEGNPFFLEELARSLTDAPGDIRLPDTVERLVLARIDRLPPRTREVARAASVLGRQFETRLLEAVAGSDVPVALLELERAEVVRTDGPARYRFKHTLIQEAVYGSLLRRTRRVLHGRAALSLEGFSPERHNLLAQHWTAAGDDERALTEHARAARAALAVYGMAEAAEHTTLGLEAAGRLGLDAQDGRVRRLLLTRGRVRFFSHDQESGERDFEEALSSARAAGDRRGELAALVDLGVLRRHGLEGARRLADEALELADALGDVEAVVTVLGRRAILDAGRLRLDAAQEGAQRAQALSEAAGDERLLGRALDALKLVALMLGDLPRLEAVAGRAAAIYRRHSDGFLLEWTLLDSSFVPLGRARFDEARSLIEEALALNAEIGDVSHRSLFVDTLAWLERSRGDHAAAIEAGREALALARRLGPPDFTAWSSATLGWIQLEAGDAAAAATILADGLELARGCEAAGQELRCAGLLAAARAQLGDTPGAARAAEHAQDVIGRIRVPPGGGFVFGGHATLALAGVRLEQGDVATAQRLAAPLLDAAAHSGWVETEAQAALIVARCRRARGDHPGAETLHRRALELCERAALPAVERAAALAMTGR